MSKTTDVAPTKQASDHDLLIVLSTKFDVMASDIKDLKDGTTSQIAINSKRLTEVEKQQDEMRTIVRTLRWLVLAISGVVTLVVATLSGVVDVFIR